MRVPSWTSFAMRISAESVRLRIPRCWLLLLLLPDARGLPDGRPVWSVASRVWRGATEGDRRDVGTYG